jgi:hypothetical protein
VKPSHGRRGGSPPLPVVLFYTDNGIGLGHLTRQAAIASRSGGAFRPAFLTMSLGYTLLRELGIPAEYFPSYGVLGIPKEEWEPLVARRLLETIRLSNASVVVVDHVSPPRIFEFVRAQAEHVKFVWSRRGLWQPGKNMGALRASADFDLIVEPGDLASPLDHGATVERRNEVVPTSPIILTDPADFLPRDEARTRLKIPLSGPAFMINLGDSDPAEAAYLTSHARSVVESVLGHRAHFFAPLHPLHGTRTPRVEGVRRAPVYPVAPYLNAFDGSISSAGYNSFHEVVASVLPAVFVAHRGARIDDQARRAEFGALSGRAHWASDIFDASFRVAVQRMLRPTEKAIAKLVSAHFGDLRGAYEFADILAVLAQNVIKRSRHESVAGGGIRPELGDSVIQVATPGSQGTLIVALEHDGGQLRDLANSSPPQRGTSVVLVRDGNPLPLHRRKILFESVMTEAEWSQLETHGYETYLEIRIAGIMERYNLGRIITISPGQDLVGVASKGLSWETR